MNAATVHAEPVTVVYSWEVQPGRNADFEQWLQGIDAQAAHFPGYQSVTWLRPETGSRLYHAIVRFNDSSSLTDWMRSETRATWQTKVTGIATEVDPRLTTTGMETWFSLPRTPVHPPSRWKMALVTGCAVYPLVPLLDFLVGDTIEHWPLLLRLAVAPALLSVILTYAVLPAVSRILQRWLYPDA